MPTAKIAYMRCTIGFFFNLISMVCACVHVIEQDCLVIKQGTRKYAFCAKCQKCLLIIFLFDYIFQDNFMQEIGVLFIFYAVNEQLANITSKRKRKTSKSSGYSNLKLNDTDKWPL